MATKKDILLQLHSLRHTGFDAKLENSASRNHLPATLLFAIASRETNCTNELGDYRDGAAHGVGIIQIDIQHDIALRARDDGTWKTNPDPLIDFGAEMLAQNLSDA